MEQESAIPRAAVPLWGVRSDEGVGGGQGHEGRQHDVSASDTRRGPLSTNLQIGTESNAVPNGHGARALRIRDQPCPAGRGRGVVQPNEHQKRRSGGRGGVWDPKSLCTKNGPIGIPKCKPGLSPDGHFRLGGGLLLRLSAVLMSGWVRDVPAPLPPPASRRGTGPCGSNQGFEAPLIQTKPKNNGGWGGGGGGGSGLRCTSSPRGLSGTRARGARPHATGTTAPPRSSTKSAPDLRGGGLARAVLETKGTKLPDSGTLGPPHGADRRVTAVGHRPTAVG